jgi:site-specific recombinase XerC
MTSHDRRDRLPPRPEVTIPATTQQAIAGFGEYLAVERHLSLATQAVYRRDLYQFFAAWQQQGTTPPLIC